MHVAMHDKFSQALMAFELQSRVLSDEEE